MPLPRICKKCMQRFCPTGKYQKYCYDCGKMKIGKYDRIKAGVKKNDDL